MCYINAGVLIQFTVPEAAASATISTSTLPKWISLWEHSPSHSAQTVATSQLTNTVRHPVSFPTIDRSPAKTIPYSYRQAPLHKRSNALR